MKKCKMTPCAALVSPTGLLALSLLAGCGDINNSWEVKGGGYIKYSVNGSEKYTIELEADDCILTSVNRHYITCGTKLENSKRGDQIAFMVNEPSTNGKLPPVPTTISRGQEQNVTWMILENSKAAPLVLDSSYIHFDEIIRDSLWTANINFYFQDCRSGKCDESAAPVHITGRFRYWVSEDDR